MINPELLNALNALNPFIRNVEKISRLKRCIKITDHFSCTSVNVIYCITWKKLYIDETGRRISDRFREHLRDVEKDNSDSSKPVARHVNLPNYSKQHMAVCGLFLHQGRTKSREIPEQNSIFQISTPHGINVVVRMTLFGTRWCLLTQTLIEP